MEKIDHPEGEIWKLDNKYFFVSDRSWRVENEQYEVYNEPNHKDLQTAISKYPDASYFYFSKESQEFRPDEVHNWLRDDFLSK